MSETTLRIPIRMVSSYEVEITIDTDGKSYDDLASEIAEIVEDIDAMEMYDGNYNLHTDLEFEPTGAVVDNYLDDLHMALDQAFPDLD